MLLHFKFFQETQQSLKEKKKGREKDDQVEIKEVFKKQLQAWKQWEQSSIIIPRKGLQKYW